MSTSIPRRCWAAAIALAGLACAPLAQAETGGGSAVVAWSTYLRAGPGDAYAAISELEHDARVRVIGRQGRWLRVSDGAVMGYVDGDALTLARTAAPAPPARDACAVAGLAENRGPIATRFCSARLPAAEDQFGTLRQ